MNGIARRFLGGGLGGSSSKDTPPPASEPAQPPQPPTVAPLAIGKSGQWSSSASPATATGWSPASAQSPVSPERTRTRTGSTDGVNGSRVVDDSTVRQRPPRTSSKSSASALVSPPGAPPMIRATPHIPPEQRPVVNTKGTKNGMARTVNGTHTKDELLMSLLASEAIVDSRGAEILSAEQVEELKKEDTLLQSRYASSTKKLALETKMRDAARSLATLNAANKTMSKQTQEQLDIAAHRLESAQADHMQIQSRAAEVRRRLLEHRAAVLSAALRKSDEDSGSERLSASVPSSNAMSPMTATSATSVSGLSKFDGAHLFAGHAEAAVPASPRGPVVSAEYEQMAERVRAAEASAKAAAKAAAELKRDLGLLKLEKAEVETTAALEAQQTEELVAELRREVAKLDKTQAWEKEREELAEDVAQRDRQIEELQEKLESLERELGSRGKEDNTEADVELEGARKALRAIVRSQRLNMHALAGQEADGPPDQSVFSVANMVAAIASHIESLDDGRKSLEKSRRELEDRLHDEQLAKEKLLRQLDESRQDTQESLRQIGTLERQMQEQTDRIVELSRSESSGIANIESTSTELQRIMAVLNPLWAMLPSAEVRASKLSNTQASRDPLNSPVLGSPRMGRPSNAPPLISDADVRGLRMLYDPNGPFLSPPPPGKFSIEAFGAKIRALVADDRAIIERLLKFASTHELLKTNAEKAQKLAQESTVSLKTYQDQVQTLEDRNNTLTGRQAALLEELEQIQAAYEELLEIKQQLEVDAARQAEVCASLTEANNQLSAQALTLAEDASAPVAAVRAKLDAEVAELKKKSDELEAELDRVRNAEQDQRVALLDQRIALLDELNSVQTENTNLRNQIRALQSR